MPRVDPWAVVRRFVAVFGALVSSACAPTVLLSDQTDAPLTANLPLSLAGVSDERTAFAALFARELDALGLPAETGTWLHSVPGAMRSPDKLDLLDQQFAARRERTAVLVVPGFLGDCIGDQALPFGDGLRRPAEKETQAAYDIYADLGLADLRLLAVPGRASSASNGAKLAKMLRDEASRPDIDRIVIIAYSKGVPDTLEALAYLQAEGGVPPAVKALVSVAGAVLGTPLADHYAALYVRFAAPLAPWHCAPSSGGELVSLTRRSRLAWLATHPLPPSLVYYSVVAYAAEAKIAPALRHTYALLAASDPRNDGQLIAADAILPGSAVLAAADADHWRVALPLAQSDYALLRLLAGETDYPRTALFRSLVRWSVAQSP